MSRIDIRYQYVLGFKPLSADGKYHKVALKLAGRAPRAPPPRLWRSGYIRSHRVAGGPAQPMIPLRTA